MLFTVPIYNRRYFPLSTLIRRKSRMGLKAVLKRLLKKQEHTSQIPKGLTSPILKLYLLFNLFSQRNLFNSSSKNSGSKSQQFSTRAILTPQEVFGNKKGASFGYHTHIVVLLAFITWGAGCQMSCNALPHKEEPC